MSGISTLRSRELRATLPVLMLVAMSWTVFPGAALAEVAVANDYAVRPLAQIQRHDFARVTAVDMALEDAQRETNGEPYRFALPVDVALTPDNAGTWESLPDGRSLWRLHLASPGVLSLNLGFVRFNLPTGAQLLVYPAADPTAGLRLDAQFNADHDQVWTPVFLADELVVELAVAAIDRGLVDLELGAIGRGYRFFGEDAADKSGDCNVNVVCAEGDDWRDEINSVGMVQVNGTELCTGFMINNTASDGRPLFMTANHCSVTALSASALVVYWNYESPVCGTPGGGSLLQFSSGATWLASNPESDFAIVELDEPPTPAYGVKYAGWDRSSGNPTSATCIHHPATDEKSISFEIDPLTTTTYLQIPSPGNGTHLRVEDWDVGTTEGGSSGSPLFNEDHRVVGQLHGGAASCANDLSDWYGRFSVSWDRGSVPGTRLRDHLDVGNTGAMTADLLDPQTLLFLVTQVGDGTSTGFGGGPFEPTSHAFSVGNTRTEVVDYVAETTATWLSLAPVSGTLGSGQQVEIIATLTEAANTLPPGVHVAEITFSNPDIFLEGITREVVLTVNGRLTTLVGPVPNPFTTPPVEIRLTLREAGTVRAHVTNIRGFKIRDLDQFAGTAGANAILWDGRDNDGHRVPSGVYVVTVEALGQTLRTNVVYAH